MSRFTIKYIFVKNFHLIQRSWPIFFAHLKSKNFFAISYFIKKMLWKIYILLMSPVALFFVIIIRLIRPLILIRMNILVSERIGHLAGNTELYLCERDAGINLPKSRHIDLWYHNWPISNNQLALMWNRILHVVPSWILGPIYKLNLLIPGYEIHLVPSNSQADIDVHNLLDKYPPHLQFSPEEEKKGQTFLNKIGISDNSPFVCLIVRDSNYLEKSVPWKSWSYHDYRDCNINNYCLAAQKLTESGYYVIRMGVEVKEPFNMNNPLIIDYATNGLRTEFMDIYLASKCAFCVVGNAGFEAVPRIFRRPIVYVDHVPFGMICTDSSRLISTTKKHFLRDENRLMTFKEIFESGADVFWFSSKYDDLGITLMESSPEEILAVVLEMRDRLEGTWKSLEENEELQRKFWEIFPKTEFHGEIRSLIGADFLLKNKEWLI
jgi:putative glycosyltransferase (TIGR04372 family)